MTAADRATLTKAITKTVAADVQQRNAQMITGGSGAAVPPPAPSAADFTAKRIATITSDNKVLNQQRALYAKYGEAFSGVASSTIHVDSLKPTASGVEAQVSETTYLHRTPDQNGKPRPDYGYDFTDTVEFVKVNGVLKEDSVTHPKMQDADLPETVAPGPATVRSWNDGTAEKQYKRLLADLKKPQYMPPNTHSDATSKPSAASPLGAPHASAATWPSAMPPLAQPAMFRTFTSHANRAAVVTYALRYGTSRNLAWPAPSSGDDCTSFASQALLAGGWDTSFNFNWRDINNWWGLSAPVGIYNYSWENAEYLFEYGVYVKGQMQGANGTSSGFAPPGLQAGDIAFFIWNMNNPDWKKAYLWDHTAIVTYVDSYGSPYFTEHSHDHVNKSLASMLSDGSEPADGGSGNANDIVIGYFNI